QAHDVRAGVQIGLAVLKGRTPDPFDGDHGPPGPALRDHFLDFESEAGKEPAEPLEPARERLLVVTLSAQRMVAREHVVHVVGDAPQHRREVRPAHAVERAASPASNDRVVHASLPSPTRPQAARAGSATRCVKVPWNPSGTWWRRWATATGSASTSRASRTTSP